MTLLTIDKVRTLHTENNKLEDSTTCYKRFFTRLKPKTSYSVVFMVLLLCGCKEIEFDKEEPIGLISEQVLAEVIADYALAESAANLNIKGILNAGSDSIYAFNPLEERSIRKSQYDSTLAYYSEHTEVYKKIYEKVLEILSAKQSQFQQTKADSISK